jgi:glycosyltransferase involved in cell wall biosynthesis
LSVVLCTYNGERYLPAQLESLAGQTRLPDELIVQDDGSTDATARIVRDFARSARFDVRLFENPARLGVTGNFASALRRATGDLLTVCDQDDVWLPEKLAVLDALLEKDTAAAGACADAACVTADGDPTGSTVWGRIGFGERDRAVMTEAGALGPLVRCNVVPGATLLFRHEFLDLLLPFSEHGYYDYWMALLLQAGSRLAFAEVPLQLYRLHPGNSVGLDGPGRSLDPAMREWRRGARREQAAFAADALRRLSASTCALSARTRLELEDWASHSAFRADLPRPLHRRVGPVARRVLAGTYGRYSDGAARGLVSGLYDVLFG